MIALNKATIYQIVAVVAQGEHFLGKEEVMGSNPINSSKVAVNKLAAFFFIILFR